MTEQPIHTAVTDGNVAEVRRLLQGGVNVEAKNHHGWTPLISASDGGKLEVVKYLVEEAEADVEAKRTSSGDRPLMYASANGHLPVVQYLVEVAGVYVEAQNNNGKTSLDLARQYSRTEVVQYLEQGPRQRQQTGLPTFPSLPKEPQFSSNQGEFSSALEQWVQNVESVLSDYLAKFDEWKERQNASSQSKVRALDEKIAAIEREKAVIRQQNTETVSQASEDAEALVRQCERKIADTREIIENLGVGGRARASAPSSDQDDQNPPISLCCPITLQLMTDPVMIVEDGHTYERSAILEHWRTQEAHGIPVTSPQTNQPIATKQLVPIVAMRSLCREWKDQHPNWSP